MTLFQGRNFNYIGSVILESRCALTLYCRHSKVERGDIVGHGLLSTFELDPFFKWTIASFFSIDANGLYQHILFGNSVLANNDYLVESEEALKRLPTTVTELWMAPFEFLDLMELSFTVFPNLHTLVFGKRSANEIESIEVSGLNSLERIIVDSHCFCDESGSCRITNCPSLQIIQIGDESFVDYDSFEVSGLPSLQCIHMGMSSFRFTQSLQLLG